MIRTSIQDECTLASWQYSPETKIFALRKDNKVSFMVEGAQASIMKTALDKMQGWIPPEEVDCSDLSLFYSRFKPVAVHDESELILSLIDREIFVLQEKKEKMIRIILSIENQTPHLRIQSDKVTLTIPAENIRGIGTEIFLPIKGKITPQMIERIARIADLGIVAFNLDEKVIEFGVTPLLIYIMKTQTTLSLDVDLADKIWQIKDKILKKEVNFEEVGDLFFHQYEKLEGYLTLKDLSIGHGSMLYLNYYIQVFIKTLTAKTVALNVSPSDTIAKLKQKLEKVEGIPVHQQKMIYAGKEFENDRLISDYGVEGGNTFHLVLRLRGGLEKLDFADLSEYNEKIITIVPTGPSWRRAAPGLNLIGICAKTKNEVLIQKKFGTFNMSKLVHEAPCPCCGIQVVKVNNCGFFKCVFSVKGKIKASDSKTIREIERFNVQAPDDEFLSFNVANGGTDDSISKYLFLKITTEPKPKSSKSDDTSTTSWWSWFFKGNK